MVNALFSKRMQELMGERYEDFIKTLDQKAIRSLYYNTLKADKNTIRSFLDFPVMGSRFNPDCDYYDTDQIGKTIANDLGLIYPQELSASLPALVLAPKGNKLIVDMCSAPGGKSINLLNIDHEEGLLVSNEFDYKRASVLVSNLERIGAGNVIITNKDTSSLAEILQGQADYVLLDAPCSGEGMIRKNPSVLDNYGLGNIQKCAALQKNLLDDAYTMLKDGGYMVYSTCTYAKEENEDNVAYFLAKHPDMSLLPIDKFPDHGSNFYSWGSAVARFTPLDQTEGQFMALFCKHQSAASFKPLRYLKTSDQPLVKKFIADQLDIDDYYLYCFNDRYYLSLRPLIDLGDHVIRYGIFVGTLKKQIFIPEHHFYRANILKDHYRKVIEITDDEFSAYRQGLSIYRWDLPNGYYALFYHGYPFSFSKCSDGELKNKYPKGLRY